jgi:uncharacterized protein (TIGR03546 family)
MLLRLLAKILKVLNSEGEPWQISLGAALAMVMGLTPVMSMHNLVVLLLVLVLRANLSSFIAAFVVFSGIAYLLDPMFHAIGLKVLESGGLREMWTGMYQSPFWRLTRFNNTIVMGSLIFSLVAFVPLFLGLNVLIRKYRENILAWIRKTRLMKMFQASKVYSIYQKVSGW